MEGGGDEENAISGSCDLSLPMGDEGEEEQDVEEEEENERSPTIKVEGTEDLSRVGFF